MILNESDLIAAIRRAIEISNADAPGEVAATFQRRGIAIVSMQIARGLWVDGPACVLFMDKCGFVGQIV